MSCVSPADTLLPWCTLFDVVYVRQATCPLQSIKNGFSRARSVDASNTPDAQTTPPMTGMKPVKFRSLLCSNFSWPTRIPSPQYCKHNFPAKPTASIVSIGRRDGRTDSTIGEIHREVGRCVARERIRVAGFAKGKDHIERRIGTRGCERSGERSERHGCGGQAGQKQAVSYSLHERWRRRRCSHVAKICQSFSQ